ncbi:MAG: hypothetical protein HOP33_14480 [Verrucomicrobia bacterium]|nr:hypothetical protein [Verrucomicrobiota bacterium]
MNKKFMSSWTFAGKWRAALSCLLMLPALAGAQGDFVGGGEYSIAGQLRADQSKPRAAISHEGGYLVWQDNVCDRDGLGIRAVALNANLQKSGAMFRVNTLGQYDQENPRVALLRGGGAVFVWQGGRPGFQKVHARFLSSAGSFVTGDVRVSAYTNGFQIHPDVATLADGSVIVVWASLGQDGSYQGVYGQRFASNGGRLGNEFRINQFTSNNQRTPSVAALTNGNFVVAWVSELQRASQSVDIFARIFNSAGGAVADEFPVNLSISNVCANPSVSASILDGGFGVAWSQDERHTLTVGSSSGQGSQVSGVPASRSTNSWDVLARLYAANGTAATGEIPVNTTTYGDQFAPDIKSFGTRYAVVWTSLGQDGQREGVYGQFIGADGLHAGGEFRVNDRTISRQLQPALASDNHSQVLALWSSFVGGGFGFDIVSKRYETANVIPLELITNSLPPISTPTTTGLPQLAFPTPDESGDEPVPNAFTLAAGTYNGLVYDKFGVGIATCGYVSVKTTSKATYSGKVQIGGATYSIKGKFDDSGWASTVVQRRNSTPLTVYLQVDLTGGDNIRGGVSDGDFWSDLQADRQVFNKSLNPTQLAGKYTVLIPGTTNGPAGDCFGTVTVDLSGGIRFNGTLADGTKVTQMTTLSKDGYWPLYLNLYRGGGALIGWVEFENNSDSDFDGSLVWLKTGGLVTPSYPAGFTNEVEAVGSRYVAPLPGTRALNLTDGVLSFSGGNLGAPFSAIFGLTANNLVIGEPGLVMNIVTPQGLFKGTVNNGSSGGLLGFQGALLQKANRGGGFFLRNNLSGGVKLNPVP